MSKNIKNEFICPLAYSMSVIGGKWKPRILCVLSKNKVLRYSQLRAELNDITDIMLSKSLKELEYHNIIIRKQYNEIPPKVEYFLSEKGNTVIPILLDIVIWGKKNQ